MREIEHNRLFPIADLHGRKYSLVKSISLNAAIAWAKECFPDEIPMDALRFNYEISQVHVLWLGMYELMETCHIILEEGIDK